jgi:hypothetical protein
MILLLVVLMGANTQNPDICAYQFNYENNRTDSFEIGYLLLVKLFKIFGFEYNTFRIILSAIGILLIDQTVNKLLKNKSPFYLLYFIYPFFMDVVQVKNFLAMALFIFSVPYLISGKKIDILKYVMLIISASLIHVTAISYLPLIFFIKKQKTILFKVMFIEAIIFLSIISFNDYLLHNLSAIIINNLSLFEDRVAIYAYRQTNLGFLLFWFIQFMNFLLVYYSNRIYKCSKVNMTVTNEVNTINNKKNKFKINNFQFKYVELVFWINFYAFLFLPLYVFHSTFSRLMRNIIPLNLLAYIIASMQLPKRSLRKVLFITVYIAYNLFLFYIDIYWLYSDTIVKAIFEHNWLFK